MKLSKNETASDRQYWARLTELLNWRLQTFAGREHAAFITGRKNWKLGSVLQLTSEERDDIVDKIEGRK